MLAIRGLLFLVLLAVASAEDKPQPERWDFYNYFRTRMLQKQEDVDYVLKIQDMKGVYRTAPAAMWKEADVIVSPEVLENFRNVTEDGPVVFMRFSDNFQRDNVDYNNREDYPSLRQNEADKFDWNDFYTLETINKWIEDQAKAHPDIATVITAGKSFWNRTLTGLKIAHKPGLPIIFIQGGSHAREWITPSTATWFIQQALTSDSEVIKKFEWHVFPVVNPDGYQYTRWNRGWIKNMQPLISSTTCIGSNLERNWPPTWSVWAGNECDETYAGNGDGSQNEVKGLMDYLGTVTKDNRTVVYIVLLGDGQSVMYPNKYPQANTMQAYQAACATVAAKMGTRYGYQYKYGTYRTYKEVAVSGNSLDYAQKINIPFPLAIALRDGNPGKKHYLTPAMEIKSIVTEAFDGVEALLGALKYNGPDAL